MRFGICAPPAALETAVAAGYDYLEPSVTTVLKPEMPEAEVLTSVQQQFAASRLRPEAFNLFLPPDMKVVGPDTDTERQKRYLEAAFRRAKLLGGEIVVFGSGGARRIPDGWSAAEAHTQMQAFLTRCGQAAEHHGVIVAIEPLNRSECNFITSVAEASALAEEVGHPNVGVLSDLYHVAYEGQDYSETRDAARRLCHVHVAGLGRRGPVAEDYEFLRGYFAILKEVRYAGRISIEANWESIEEQAAAARQVLERAWNDA